MSLQLFLFIPTIPQKSITTSWQIDSVTCQGAPLLSCVCYAKHQQNPLPQQSSNFKMHRNHSHIGNLKRTEHSLVHYQNFQHKSLEICILYKSALWTTFWKAIYFKKQTKHNYTILLQRLNTASVQMLQTTQFPKFKWCKFSA